MLRSCTRSYCAVKVDAVPPSTLSPEATAIVTVEAVALTFQFCTMYTIPGYLDAKGNVMVAVALTTTR